MKLRLIYILLVVAFIGIIFQSNSSGPAFVGNGDRTGSPVSSGTCASCHSGGSFGTTYSITVKDGIGNTVTSYTPGGSYFVEFRVNSTSGTRYGSQGVAITSSNAQAGNFGTPTSTNTRRTTFGGRQYIEHNGFATGAGSFTFRAPWTAPAAGTGNVRIYGVGMTVNGTGSTSGDQPSGSTMITITETPFATINYTNTNYCANGTNPTPSISGTQGGSFTASPSGLSINASTGAVNLSASTPGQTYTVTYTYGGGLTTTDMFSITAADNAAFSYTAGSSFCKTETDPSPTITGLTGGTFSSTVGLSINPSTGLIDLSASQSGTYTVTYTTNGTCPNSSGVPITILPMDNAQFTLGGSMFCQSGPDRSPTGGTPGGTWTGSAGLVVNSSTGTIDVSASTVGSHTLTYVTNGTCPDSNTMPLTIVATDDASFTVSDTAFCQAGLDGSVTITGTSGGSFSGSAGLSVDPSTGAIDVSASMVGNHQITYITNGLCRDTMSQSVAIYSGNAQFTYGTNTFCQNANNPIPMGGSSGGWWFGTPGLVVDTLTGVIDIVASTVGSHTVSHVIGGFCPDSVGMAISIVAADSAEFAFVDTTFCLFEPNPILAVTGTTTGTYSSSPSGLTFVDNTTGEIDFSNSSPGFYTYTYISNGTCPDTTTATLVLSICAGLTYLENENYTLYPNPNEGNFSIKNTKSEEDLIVKILDIQGRVVFLKNYFIPKNSSQGIEITSLPKGTYFVQIIGKEQLETIKMDIK